MYWYLIVAANIIKKFLKPSFSVYRIAENLLVYMDLFEEKFKVELSTENAVYMLVHLYKHCEKIAQGNPVDDWRNIFSIFVPSLICAVKFHDRGLGIGRGFIGGSGWPLIKKVNMTAGDISDWEFNHLTVIDFKLTVHEDEVVKVLIEFFKLIDYFEYAQSICEEEKIKLRQEKNSMSKFTGLINIYDGIFRDCLTALEDKLNFFTSIQTAFPGKFSDLFLGYVNTIQNNISKIKTVMKERNQVQAKVDYILATNDPARKIKATNILRVLADVWEHVSVEAIVLSKFHTEDSLREAFYQWPSKQTGIEAALAANKPTLITDYLSNGFSMRSLANYGKSLAKKIDTDSDQEVALIDAMANATFPRSM